MVDALTIAHLAGALWMAAGAGTLTLITFAGGRATDRFALRFSAKLQRLSVLAAIVPGSLLAVAFGSWLASELEYSFGGACLSGYCHRRGIAPGAAPGTACGASRRRWRAAYRTR